MRSLKVLLVVGGLVGPLATCTPFVPSQDPYRLLDTLPPASPVDLTEEGSRFFPVNFETNPTQITTPIANPTFRKLLDIVLENDSGVQLVETKLAAWIQLSSLPQDEELRRVAEGELRGDGWVLQDDDLVLGRLTITGPVYVYRRGRTDGGVAIDLKIAAPDANLAELRDSLGAVLVPRVTFITPDGFLLFHDFPDSCESIAFLYTVNGVTTEGISDGSGGRKLFRQVQGYQCDPFQPGFFLNTGGTRRNNEYFEGDGVNVRFLSAPTDEGKFAEVVFFNRQQVM